MAGENSRQLAKGALILTAAALFVKILSAVYRVPFQNIVGDKGFYVYQQIYPIYGIAVALSIYGFPVVISKLLVESGGNSRRDGRDAIIQASFVILLAAGTSLFALLFLGAPAVAFLMGDEDLAPLIKVISFIFLLLPFLSVWRGYFQSRGHMGPTAASQVAEQAVRVAAILLLSYWLIHSGRSLYAAGAGALAGSIIGGCAGLALLFRFAMKERLVRPLLYPPASLGQYRQIGKILLFQGLAVCLSNLLLLFFQLTDSFQIYSLLVKSGLSPDDAKALKGVFDRGQPLIQLGTVAATSISLTLVPAVSALLLKGSVAELETKAKTALKVSAGVGAAAALGLAMIIKPVNIMLFENESGSGVLGVLAFSIFFASVILTGTGILQGLGHVFAPARYMAAGLAVKYVCNLLFIPSWGTAGAAAATIAGLAVTALLISRRLESYFSQKLISRKEWFGIAKAAAVMAGVLLIWGGLIVPLGSGRAWSSFAALGGVAAGGLSYIYMLVREKWVGEEELAKIPLGKMAARLSANRTDRRRDS